ncbi:MAG: hypothetical protein HGB12_15780, partial [Bacteroidetes bacterium]|nr:hypothetical protein [Bacteroidota bacterium]
LMPCALCLFFTFHFSLFTFQSFSQGAAINSTGAAAENSAMLDISSTNQGIRIPRVKLLSTTDITTIQNPVNSLLVFDSISAGDITTAGYYYWDTTATPDKWVKLLTSGTGWQLNGNTGTNSGAKFLGTTDNFSLGFRTNNNKRMIIDSLGNVGIGITNPNHPFYVRSNASSNTSEYVAYFDRANWGTGEMYLGFRAGLGHQYMDVLSSGDIQWWATSDDVNYFNPLTLQAATGNVGIGTIGPVGLLNVHSASGDPVTWITRGDNVPGNTVTLRLGNNNVTYENYSAYVQAIQDAGIDRYSLAFGTSYMTAASERMRVLYNGNVGIGTTVPGKKTEISFDDASTTLTQGLLLTNINNTVDTRTGIVFRNFDNYGTAIWSRRTGCYAGDLIFGTKPNSYGAIGEAGIVERMRIDNIGNVGIGTTAPSQLLHLKGGDLFIEDTSDPKLGFGHTGNTINASVYRESSTGNFFLKNDQSGGYLVVAATNVGIGTTTVNYKLTVNGQPAANGYTAFTNYSDSRLKKNVTNIDNCLNKIMQLCPVQFNYNEEYLNLYNDTSALTRVQKGFIAQDVKKIFPEMVSSVKVRGKEYYDLNLSNLQVYLVKAMQEQQKMIKEQQKMIDSLKLENGNLHSGFSSLQTENKNLEKKFSSKLESQQAEIEKIKQMLNMEAKK